MDPASPEIIDMVKALVANQVTIDPTLVAFDLMVRGDDPSVVYSGRWRLLSQCVVSRVRRNDLL